MLTPEQLAEWERLANAAMPAPDDVPYRIHPPFDDDVAGGCDDWRVVNAQGNWVLLVDDIGGDITRADDRAKFYLTAHEAIPALIATLRERDAEIGRLRSENRNMQDEIAAVRKLECMARADADRHIVERDGALGEISRLRGVLEDYARHARDSGWHNLGDEIERRAALAGKGEA